jgi:hypothetical protein
MESGEEPHARISRTKPMQMPIPMLQPLHAYNTARPVDARWKWVEHLADAGKLANDPDDDEWIKRGLTYLNRLRACKAETDRGRLAFDMPDFDAAHRLHTSSKLDRGEVEGRLLARQTVEDVSGTCGLTVKAVSAYEALFFEVLHRLDAHLFIILAAVRITPCLYNVKEDEVDVLLRFFAYTRGLAHFELALRYFRNGIQIPERLDQASRADLEELVEMMAMKAGVLAVVLPFAKMRRAFQLMALAKEIEAFTTLKFGMPGVEPAKPVSQRAASLLEAMDPEAKPTTLVGATGSKEWCSSLREAVMAA